jgi:hypothetical protein
MDWAHAASYFFAGAFLTNAIPQLVSGLMGRPFQSPFASPPGKGLSSSTVNFLWGFFNAAVGYGLIAGVGTFDPRSAPHVVAVASGSLLIGFICARMFGRLHGGDARKRQ